MKISRRAIVLGAMTAPLAEPFTAEAQNWPSGVIRIIVPFPPGGTTDPIARMVQPGLQKRLGATLIVENKPGASGSVGTGLVVKSPHDGNTWLFVFDTHAVNPFLFNLPFDTAKDLDPVMLIGTAPNVLATHPSRPFKSLADVIAAAKEKPDTLTYASVGSGSGGHLTMTLLAKRAGCKLVHVPYKGGGPAMNDALAGHVDMIIGSAALCMPQIKAHNIRPLMQTGKTRSSLIAGRADGDRERLYRLRILRLVGRVRAGQDAEADRGTLRRSARRIPARDRPSTRCSPKIFRSRSAWAVLTMKQNSSPSRWRCGGRS